MIIKYISNFSLIFLIIICNLLAIKYLYIINRQLKKYPFTHRQLSEIFWVGSAVIACAITRKQFNYYIFIVGVILVIIGLIKDFKTSYIKVYNVKSLSKLTSVLEDTLDSNGIKYNVTHGNASSAFLEHEITIYNYRKVPNFKNAISDLKKKIGDINDDKIQPKIWGNIISASFFIIASLSVIFAVIYKL